MDIRIVNYPFWASLLDNPVACLVAKLLSSAYQAHRSLAAALISLASLPGS